MDEPDRNIPSPLLVGPTGALSDAQITDLEGRVADPGPVATAAEVEAFFDRFQTSRPYPRNRP
jgi:hypothetical protein